MKKDSYILQQYNGKDCTNIFYHNENDVLLGQPEKATQFNTIGEAMKISAEIYKKSGVLFKVVKYYVND